MFKKSPIVKINLPGGIVAPGDLYAIVEAAERARVTDMQFGTRQQLFCKVTDRYAEQFFGELEKENIFYETEAETHPNIISSYVTEEVFGRSNWVSEGLYKDILAGFDFRPRVKVNLLDSGQSLLSFFSGHINLISSPVNNHWYLYIRRPRSREVYPWKAVIYSPDIPRVCRQVEAWLLSGLPLDQWEAQGALPVAPVADPLVLTSSGLPYYEGFNRYGNRYWLGIYRREEEFALSFLKEVCSVALQSKVGQLYTTPWKTLLIKNIEEKDLLLWEYALGRHRINVRHASNELNWQVEDFCPEGLRLKRYLVRQLDQEDVRTEGLTFSIRMRPGSGLSGSVMIKLQDGRRGGQDLPGWGLQGARQAKVADRYEIGHTPGFDPHSSEYVLYRKDLEKENLFPYLVSLCKEYYQLRSGQGTVRLKPAGAESVSTKVVYECGDCLTIYDEDFGDPAMAIEAGRQFATIREVYSCPVCGGAGLGFRAVEKKR